MLHLVAFVKFDFGFVALPVAANWPWSIFAVVVFVVSKLYHPHSIRHSSVACP